MHKGKIGFMNVKEKSYFVRYHLSHISDVRFSVDISVGRNKFRLHKLYRIRQGLGFQNIESGLTLN